MYMHIFSLFVRICRPKEYELSLLSAQRNSATSLAFSVLLSLRPQIVLLGNTGHLSRLNCHTNRFLSAIQFVLGSMPTKTKASNLKQQIYPPLTATNCCVPIAQELLQIIYPASEYFRKRTVFGTNSALLFLAVV